ncbi:DUF6541 family protein [Pseudofrankia inefficax]|uniref:Uncharacterized protein n=1 Tax=Pseudofrankia inefficax (strain DSM 45817 / CECT 9037 / DDB 130130 / EuI1c) TaxID=298654 RepID=E3IW38_PSEI1|nr:DUF6541 family protein [Pseudofrankia inefficax]ADP84966.1 hypothetical protein FraEuI1c_6999 [Pseudofrankia inefficax]
MTVDVSSPETTVPLRLGRRRPTGPGWRPHAPTTDFGDYGWRLWLARIDAPTRAVLLIAVCSFVGSLLLQTGFYREGSGDADEAAYVLQARMLLDGRLTLDSRVVEPFFQPWLTGMHGTEVFTKYLPGWPALLAASQAVFGTMAVAPAAIAACWVIGTYLLTRELFEDGWTAAIAAGLVALSPLVLLHTALPLAYAPCAAVLTLASALLLRGVRTGTRGPLIGGGALVGFALLIRPFDAVLVVGPLVLFAATRMWRTPTILLARAGWGVLGAAPFVGLLLAYCSHVTGSPLRLPQTASDPLDTFGFGPRRILPSEPTFTFTHHLAVQALQETLKAAPSWYFGGFGLIALAVVGLLAPRRRAERLLLASTTAAILIGYFFWWGSAFAMPGLRNGLGPHYHLAGFTPIVILGAAGARWLWSLIPAEQRGRRRARQARPKPLVRATALVLSFAGLTALTVPTLQGRIDVQRGVNSGNAFLDALIPDHLPGPALVVVTPAIPTHYTQLPYHTLRNSADLDGPIVYAADIGPGIAALPDRMPDRTIYRLRPNELVDADVPGSYRGSFVQLHQVQGTSIQIRVTVRPPAAGTAGIPAGGLGAGARLYVRLGDQTQSQRLPAGGASTFVLNGAGSAGSGELSAATLSAPAELVVGFTTGDGAGAASWEERFPLMRHATGDLTLLAPGLGWRRLTGTLASTVANNESQWLAARVEPTLDVALTGSDAR